MTAASTSTIASAARPMPTAVVRGSVEQLRRCQQAGSDERDDGGSERCQEELARESPDHGGSASL
jgi:hypothetical protein